VDFQELVTDVVGFNSRSVRFPSGAIARGRRPKLYGS
jgi:hypothetical protein